MDYTATWIYDRLSAMGFSGSYEIVKRKVSAIKSERQKIAYMRFETEPGYQGQVEQADGSVKKLYLFSMILGYSRKLYGELVERCDLQTFLDCHIRAFEYFGGVPEQLLYDRMKNVYIGKIAGKKKFNDTFDTSYRVYRKVHKDCTVRFESNSYVVPHRLVGKKILLRVKEKVMRIFSDDSLVVTYEIPFRLDRIVP